MDTSIQNQNTGITNYQPGESQLIDLWIKASDSAHTRRAYRQAVDSFFGFAGRGLAEATLVSLQAYKDYLVGQVEQGDLRPASVNAQLAAIKSLLTYAHEVGYLKVNAGRAIRLLKLPDTLAARIIEQADMQAIIALESNARNHALLTMLYYTGARVSEICGITWGNVTARRKAGQVTLYGKGGKTRAVKLPLRVWDMLQSLRPESACDDMPVFISRKGGPLDSSQVHRIVRAAGCRAGFDNISPHWFRHAHASHSLDRGCPVHVLRDTLGHASLATTSRYAHARPNESSSDYLR